MAGTSLTGIKRKSFGLLILRSIRPLRELKSLFTIRVKRVLESFFYRKEMSMRPDPSAAASAATSGPTDSFFPRQSVAALRKTRQTLTTRDRVLGTESRYEMQSMAKCDDSPTGNVWCIYDPVTRGCISLTLTDAPRSNVSTFRGLRSFLVMCNPSFKDKYPNELDIILLATISVILTNGLSFEHPMDISVRRLELEISVLPDPARAALVAAISPKTEAEGPTCAICLNELTESIGQLSECKHTFCFECIHKESVHSTTCPLCRTEFSFVAKFLHGRFITNVRTDPRRRTADFSPGELTQLALASEPTPDTPPLQEFATESDTDGDPSSEDSVMDDGTASSTNGAPGRHSPVY